jgi:hypothetical protein
VGYGCYNVLNAVAVFRLSEEGVNASHLSFKDIFKFFADYTLKRNSMISPS